MKRSLDTHDRIPEEMRDYLSHYGFHFNKKAYDFAVKVLKLDYDNAEVFAREKVDELLKKYSLTIKNNTLYDVAYKMSAEKAVHYGKSLPNEQMLVMHVAEDMDAKGNCGEECFREWMADMIACGEPIDWYDLL